MLFWSKNLAVYFLFDAFHSRLATLRFSLDRAITESFSYILLDLGCHVLSVSNSTKLLFVGRDKLGVDSLGAKANQVFHVGSSIALNVDGSISDGNRVGSLRKDRIIVHILELVTNSSGFLDHVELIV